MLNPLFVTYSGKFVRRTGPGFCRVFTTITVYLVKMLGLCVIRFELVVADGPGGRDSAVMPNLAKVFLAQPKQSRAVKLRVAPDEVVRVRMKFLTITIAPCL